MAVIISLLGITAVLLFLIFKNSVNVNNGGEIEEELVSQIEEKDIEISSKKEIKKEENNQTTFLIKGQILFAEENQNQKPPFSSSENPIKEYFIYSFDPKTNKKKQFGLVESNTSFFPHSFKLFGDKVFFINWNGELATLDLKSKKQEIIKIPGIIPTKEPHSKDVLSIFTITDNDVLYVKGYYNTLGLYNLVTSENKILIDDLDKKIDFAMSRLILKSYNSSNNSLEFLLIYGDAGVVSARLYNFDINKSVKSELGRVSYEADGHYVATEEIKSEIKKYKEFIGEEIFCDNFNVDDFIQKIKEKNNFDTDAVYFIDCIK